MAIVGLRRYADQQFKKLESKEQKVVRALLKLYEEARLDLYQVLTAIDDDSLQVQRIRAIMDELERHMAYYTDQATILRRKSVEESYTLGQELTKGIFEQAAKFDPELPPVLTKLSFGFSLVDRNVIESLFGNMPQLSGKWSTDILMGIRDGLVQGALRGESITKIANRVLASGFKKQLLAEKQPFQKIRARAVTIARTEIIKGADAGTDAMLREAKELLPDLYVQWLTAQDSKVDPPCPAYASSGANGFTPIPGYLGVYEIDKSPRVVIDTHPRCRCRRIPWRRQWIK